MAYDVKYPFTRVPNWVLTTDKLGDKEKAVLGCYYRMSIGFNGCKYTHKITFKQVSEMINMYERAVSNCSKSLEKKGLINIEQKGAKFKVIHIKNLTGKGFVDNYLKKGNVQESIANVQESISDVEESIPNVQKQHNPPPTKEIYKETSKETLNEEIDFETFRKNWFSAKESNEPLRKKLLQRFDLNRVEPIFNSLPFEQQKEVCLGTKRFVEFLQNNPNKVEWIKNASNYILKEEYKVHFKAINDEIRAENKRLEREAYLKEADRNKATDEERKNILSNWKNNEEK